MLSNIQHILCIDFESYWDSRSYTLKKLTTEEYLRDQRFLDHGAAVKWVGTNAAPVYLYRKDLPAFFASIDWATTGVVAHNAAFDIGIMSWHYGINPAFIFDTLSMARALRGVEGGNALDKLAADFGLPAKGRALHSTDGLRELPHAIHEELARYCEHDVWLCEQIFLKWVSIFPPKELRVIDLTLRMFLYPELVLDKEILKEAIVKEKDQREGLLRRLDIAEKDLASNPKFAEALRKLGVEPPTKISKTTGKPALAFAKSDVDFQALLVHDNEEIALLCEARLKVKSTLERTRAQRFLDIAYRGLMPVPLYYYAAHTGRFAAAKGAQINLQNLKRGSFLRHAIQAPPGYTLVVADLSQIEARVLALLAGNDALLNIFRSGADVYSTFGAGMFGVPGMTKDSHPVLRQSAKSAVLGCGFQLGAFSFAAQLLSGFMGAPPVRYTISDAKQMGVTARDVEKFVSYQPHVDKALAIPRTCTDEEIVVHTITAKKIVDNYRAASTATVNYWGLMTSMLNDCIIGGNICQHNCLTFGPGYIELPSGMRLKYPDLQSHVDEDDAYRRTQWTYAAGKKRKKIYAGSITENVVQAVARCVMTDAMLRIAKRYKILLTVHDEVVVLVPDSEIIEAQKWIKACMVKEPAYLPGIPLDATVSSAKRYGDAK